MPTICDDLVADGNEAQPPALGYKDSISQYFVNAENLCSVNIRETPLWSQIKDDPIFRPYRDDCKRIPLPKLVANLNRRPDYNDTEPALDVYHSRSSSPDLMDGLDRALGRSEAIADKLHKSNDSKDYINYAADKKASPPPFDRDPEQEKILISLGVMGSPKPVTPIVESEDYSDARASV
jgi:hypothetical protein